GDVWGTGVDENPRLECFPVDLYGQTCCTRSANEGACLDEGATILREPKRSRLPEQDPLQESLKPYCDPRRREGDAFGRAEGIRRVVNRQRDAYSDAGTDLPGWHGQETL